MSNWGFWYQLSEWMEQGIVAPIPKGYKLSPQASEVLKSLRQLEGGQQLTVLQDIVVNMGFETARMTPTVKQPVTPPQEAAPRSPRCDSGHRPSHGAPLYGPYECL